MKWRITIDVPERRYSKWAKELVKLMSDSDVIVASRWVEDKPKPKPTTPTINGVVPFKDDPVEEPKYRLVHPDGPMQDRLFALIRDQQGYETTFSFDEAQEYMDLLGYQKTSTQSALQKLHKSNRLEKLGRQMQANGKPSLTYMLVEGPKP